MRYGPLIGIALLGLAPLALIAGRAQTRGGVYAVPIGEARKVLEGTGLPPLVFGSDEPEVAVRAEGPVGVEGAGRIVWILHKDGAEMMRYVALLSADGDASTRISLDLVGATQGPFRNTGARLAQNGAIRHLYLVAMEERIASALERRPFDETAIMPATAAATAANIGRISADMDRIAAADQRRERENIERAYREEAAGISR
ncbi:MAG: hypothetical protein QOG13_2337 [Sphingomonadales bacterium]|jgi:hypothetical protein|nr:hypothetical protein [Sphingomonadales bacterium]